MRTVVQLANSNCPWCLSAMSDRLLARPLVRQVHVDSTAGCLVVDHDHDRPAELVAEIHDHLRGWELADNGEAVMVDLDVHEESDCRWATAPSDDRAQSEERLSAAGKRAGSFRSSVRFDPDRAVVATVATDEATTVFLVCLDGYQALAEHPAPADLTLLVIEGQPTITVEGAPTVTVTGDVMIMHEGALHSLIAGRHRAVVVGVVHHRT